MSIYYSDEAIIKSITTIFYTYSIDKKASLKLQFKDDQTIKLFLKPIKYIYNEEIISNIHKIYDMPSLTCRIEKSRPITIKFKDRKTLEVRILI